jgi:hypothetical protein
MIARLKMNRPSPAQIRAAVEQACRECDLDSRFIASVHAYVEQDEDEWPRCCGISCEPCVQTLEHAARRALILIERAAQSEAAHTDNTTHKTPTPIRPEQH